MPYLKALILAAVLFITGCGDPYVAKIEDQLPLVEKRLQQLSWALQNGEIRNASLINQYADKLATSNPDMSQLIDEFRKDATVQGPMYLALLQRLDTVKNQGTMFASDQVRYEELVNIYQAADKVLYSDALSDPLNVLADMSNGELPRVNAMSKSDELAANNAQDFGVGSQLVGNPSYGQWQTDNSGMSFWQWYGMYAMFSSLSDRIYYNRWGRNRGYSYYNDYGRSRYTSPKQYRKQQQVETRTRKSFSSQGKTFTSTYSKNRTGSSGLSRQSVTAQQSSKFRQSGSKSKYAKSNSKSKYASNSSFRNSRTKTTRSFRRGK
ncbi:hypothetical protein [Thalassotalea sp. Y01]|uniref:hypothetical protein n=1 Tax=Thalassotalea sp. Y01 TaxID=2729613 RepID=UPI00145E3DFE|nr:hypothetical protein [Thalassotalea sp. Y01]NMP15128.1 hypothetical protein [Thalassotalea sp. Y01]